MRGNYRCFTRRWWKSNFDGTWPNNLEPDGSATKYHKCYCETEDEARQWCQEWNRTHDAGRFSTKAEYERS